MYWTYGGCMRGNDLHASPSIISPQQRYTDLFCCALPLCESKVTDVVRPEPFSPEMRWVKYWFVIIPPHQGHDTNGASWKAFSPHRQCHLTATTHMDLDKYRYIFYVTRCSLRSGCRPLMKHQSTQSILSILFIPVARRRLMDYTASVVSQNSWIRLNFWCYANRRHPKMCYAG